MSPTHPGLPMRRLVSKILGEPIYVDDDTVMGSPDCAICHASMHIPYEGGSEPYPICNGCAQEAARRLARAHRARRSA